MTTLLNKKRAFLPTLALSAAFAALALLAPSARAQSTGQWVAVPCDASGNASPGEVPSDDGYVPLIYGMETGKVTKTYPDDMAFQGIFGPDDPDAFPCNATPIQTAGTINAGWYDAMIHADNNTSDGQNGYYHGVPINGAVTVNASGDMIGYFRWQYEDAMYHPAAPPDSDPMPDNMNLLIRCKLQMYVSSDKPPATASGPISAVATATDSLGDGLSDSLTAPTSGNLTRYHLVHLPVDGNGVATVDVSGTAVTRLVNHAPFESIDGGDPGAVPVIYGSNDLYGAAMVTADAAVPTIDLEADSTCDTANWDGRHPRFFSGTNCQVHAASGMDPALIKHAQLVIGTDTVATYPDPKNPNATPDLAVAFDSTHFADGTAIKVEYQVEDKAGDPVIKKDVSALAYNKMYELVCKDLDDYWTGGAASTSAKKVQFWGNYMNYTAVTPAMNDHAPDVQTNLVPNTVFYAFTHGQPGAFASSFGTPDNGDWLNPGNGKADPAPDYLYGGVGYSATQKSLNVNIPPFNFVQIDGCQAGANDGIANAFQLIGKRDTAFLSWHDDVFVSWYDPIHPDATLGVVTFTDEMWDELTSGSTLLDSAKKAISDNVVWTRDGILGYRKIPPYIYGDASMKLHSVYGGTKTDQWFK